MNPEHICNLIANKDTKAILNIIEGLKKDNLELKIRLAVHHTSGVSRLVRLLGCDEDFQMIDAKDGT
jgi:pyruvate/oxaloacetate carboxyltransferase